MELRRRISRLGQVLAACIDSPAPPWLGLTLIHLASHLDPDDLRLHPHSQHLRTGLEGAAGD